MAKQSMAEIFVHLREKHIARVVHEALQAWDAAHGIVEGHIRWDDLSVVEQRERAEAIREVAKSATDALLTLPPAPPRVQNLEDPEPLEPSREALRNVIVAALLNTVPR